MHNFKDTSTRCENLKKIHWVVLELLFCENFSFSFQDYSRTTDPILTKIWYVKLQTYYYNVWKFQRNPSSSSEVIPNFFRFLRISQELLTQSSPKFNMHNFKYTTTMCENFKEIHRVVSEEKRSQNFVIYIYIRKPEIKPLFSGVSKHPKTWKKLIFGQIC